MNIFRDKTAIVTGGASGIGRAICLELGKRGAIVHVTDIETERARQVADEIAATGGLAIASNLDVTRAESVKKLIEETAEENGHLDYMFNNAGIAIVGEVRDMNLEHWRRIVDVNLWGVIYGTKAAYSVMVRQGFGHIVNVSSLAGLAPFPSVSSYVATKYAVVGLSTAMRAEGEALGVKISVVCPGFIQTGIHYAGTLLGADREKLLQSIRVKIMDSQKAARIILEGVSRNRAIVVVTPHAHVLWRLYKYFPGIFAILARKGMKDFRAIRSESI